MFDDLALREEAKDRVWPWARDYWQGSDGYGLNETVVDGEARIIELVAFKDDEDDEDY